MYKKETLDFVLEDISMNIKKAEKGDLSEILDLQYLAYQSEARLFDNQNIPPLKQTLTDVEKEYQKGIILKALDKDKTIIGSVRAFCENETVYIGKLMVHPSKQGQGIGTQLLLEMEKQYPKQRYELFTSTRSEKNIALYKKLGYKVFDERQVTGELRFVYMEKITIDCIVFYFCAKKIYDKMSKSPENLKLDIGGIILWRIHMRL